MNEPPEAILLQTVNGQKIGKKRRSHVTKACINCQKAHVSCNTLYKARPCKRCLERGKICEDGEAKRRGRKKLSGSPVDGMSPSAAESFTKEELGGVVDEPSSILASISAKAFSNSPPPNYTMNNFNQDFGVIQQQTIGLSDLPVDLFQDMFLFSPFEALETMKLKQTSLNDSYDALERNETPSSTFSRLDFYDKMRENMMKRIPEKVVVFERAMALREQLSKIREELTEEIVLAMTRDFDTYLTTFSTVFDQLGVPSIIWERCGVIHYVSKGYVELTGFNDPLPTNVDDLAFSEQLSNDGLRIYVDGITQTFFFKPGSLLRNDTFTFPTGIKIAGCNSYVDGIMCVTIKRDMIGLPLIFIGHFIPHKKG